MHLYVCEFYSFHHFLHEKTKSTNFSTIQLLRTGYEDVFMNFNTFAIKMSKKIKFNNTL